VSLNWPYATLPASAGEVAPVHRFLRGGCVTKRIIIEEFRLTVAIPVGLTKRKAAAICATLKSTAFRRRLTGTLRRVRSGFPALAAARFTVSW
jgi:hypothetical protein